MRHNLRSFFVRVFYKFVALFNIVSSTCIICFKIIDFSIYLCRIFSYLDRLAKRGLQMLRMDIPLLKSVAKTIIRDISAAIRIFGFDDPAQIIVICNMFFKLARVLTFALVSYEEIVEIIYM